MFWREGWFWREPRRLGQVKGAKLNPASKGVCGRTWTVVISMLGFDLGWQGQDAQGVQRPLGLRTEL